MIELRLFWRPAVAGVALLAASGSVAAQADRASRGALSGVERGQWSFREAGGAAQTLCVRDPAAMLQIRHGARQCSHRLVENAGNVTTISYTCPGHGQGRTTATVETPRLVRIQTQGVVDGSPFASDLEGRRTGACS